MNECLETESIDEFLTQISTETGFRIEGMPKRKIDVIRAVFPNKVLPKEYLSFLEKAGEHFTAWRGSDYVLVNKNGDFINLAEEVKSDEEMDSEFRKYGYSYDDCFFFFGHQGNAYLFFRFDSGDDPTVYFLVPDAMGSSSARTTFTKFVKNSYLNYLEIKKSRENPWDKIPVQMGDYALRYLRDNFSYSLDSDSISIPHDYSMYRINRDRDHSVNCIEILNPILKDSIIEIRSVYVYTENTMYLYVPVKDVMFDNHVDLDIYRDKTFILESEYKWGWFTIKDKVYVFGDRFKALIEDHLDKLQLFKL